MLKLATFSFFLLLFLCLSKSIAATLTPFQQKIGYTFKDQNLLQRALIHPSSSNGIPQLQQTHNFQRLEFLGDRVLNLVIAHWMYVRYPEDDEGELAQRYNDLVQRSTLRKVADKVQLRTYLSFVSNIAQSNSEESILADGVESLICAMYLDGGLQVAETFIKRFWDSFVHEAGTSVDAKSELQQWALARGKRIPKYTLISETGPAHNPVFNVKVEVDVLPDFTAIGSKKKDAEQAAAQKALNHIATLDL